MKHSTVLAVLMLISAVDIDIGGVILRQQGLVPFILTVTTFLASGIIAVVAVIILSTDGKKGEFPGIILAILAIVVSTNPSHLSALGHFTSSVYLAAADTTMLIGFYALPITYILLFFVYRKRHSSVAGTGR